MKKGMKAVAVWIAALLVGSFSAGCTLFEAETATASKTSTSNIYTGDLVLGLSADGSITLPVTGLDFSVSGIIKNIYVSPGDMVKKGDLLAELDDTDLQLALKNAQNNLEKAMLAYEEAIATADYNLQTETLNLESAKQQLDTGFDSYSYDLAIQNAELTLARREQDYEDTVTSNKISEDAARLNLSRKEAELKEAQTALAEAEADTPAAFDEYTYQNNINSAEKAVERAKKALDDANADLKSTKSRYSSDLSSSNSSAVKSAKTAITNAEKALENAEMNYDMAVNRLAFAPEGSSDIAQLQSAVESAQKNVESAMNAVTSANTALDNALSQQASAKQTANDAIANAERSVENAQNNYDDALTQLAIAQQNMERDAASQDEDEAERIQNTLDSAQKALESAKQAVDDAQIALDNTLLDNAQRLVTARQNIDDAETALFNAKQDLARARSNYQEEQRDRKSSYDLQSLKLENMANADSSIKNALYNIDDAQNALESAENDLAKVRITSPIDGEILNVTKKVGEKATESENAPMAFLGSSNASSSFVSIRDLSEIYLTARIPEGDIVGLSEGQKIRVEVDALDGATLLATVYSISSIPTTDSSGIITYEVVGVLDEFNENIRDSMSVFLTFIKREINNVLLAPNKAVFMEDGQQYVYVQKDDGTLEKRAVTCGFSNGTQTEVKEGLEAGETVIVGKVSA